MATSRVVNRIHLCKYFGHKGRRSWTDPETVDEIIRVIARTSKPLMFPQDLRDHVCIRYHEVFKDVNGVLPFSESGGALTCANPLDLLNYLDDKARGSVPPARQGAVINENPTVSTFWNDGVMTLTFNILRKF